ncbi:hypothetical protein [Laspinema sp. D2d]|uniref:hypothetical protein n=1 Tax=Laspinema sp. D2d TaxID=2953686 RepID=UPI0021BADB44|nr:hypothetical protein [Laspinema sp. D2d]
MTRLDLIYCEPIASGIWTSKTPMAGGHRGVTLRHRLEQLGRLTPTLADYL